MRDYFNGWKRKAGVATLVVACALAGLWSRANFLVDRVSFSIWDRRQYILVGLGGVLWESEDEDRWHQPKWTTENVNHYLVSFEPPPDSLTDFDNGDNWVITYSDFVIRLTLLSAVLLLWPQRKREHRPTQS